MIKKAKWLVKEASLRVKYMTTKDCIFCKIVKGEMKSKFIFENDKVVAFNDINPVAATHILIVPKKHIESASAVGGEDGQDLVEIFKAAANLVVKNNLDAYRLAFNGGRYQHVPHLHMHLLAGNKIEWSKL
jgi:histidine triad (HIT) family protein